MAHATRRLGGCAFVDRLHNDVHRFIILPISRRPEIRMTERAVAYGRKSFDDPDERTASVDDQQLFATQYASRHGFELVAFYG